MSVESAVRDAPGPLYPVINLSPAEKSARPASPSPALFYSDFIHLVINMPVF